MHFWDGPSPWQVYVKAHENQNALSEERQRGEARPQFFDVGASMEVPPKTLDGFC